MGIESGAAAFLSGFVSTYGRETPESRAVKEMAFADTPTGIKYSQHRAEAELAHRARINEGQRKIISADILGSRKIQGDDNLRSALLSYLPTLSFVKTKEMYDTINNENFGGFTLVDKDVDFAGSEAARYGNMYNVFGQYWTHDPKGQENTVKNAYKRLAIHIEIVRKTLQDEYSGNELTNKAYDYAFNNASPTDKNLLTKYGSIFTESMDYVIGNMKDIFVTPDYFASQIQRVAQLQAVAKGSNMRQDIRVFEEKRDALILRISNRSKRRGVFSPQQYAKAMRKLFSPYISRAAILGSKNQKAFMKGQLSDPKMENRLFEILKRLYPHQNILAKSASFQGVNEGSVESRKVEEYTGAKDVVVDNE